MKRLATLLALVGALALGGCLTLDPNATSVFKGGTSITAPIVNPVQPVNIYQVKEGYDGILKIADSYRAYCYPTAPFKSYKDLMADPVAEQLCKYRRRVMIAIQKADDKAFDAIQKADSFIAVNPTVSAVSVVREAWAAVLNFQSAATSAAITK